MSVNSTEFICRLGEGFHTASLRSGPPVSMLAQDWPLTFEVGARTSVTSATGRWVCSILNDSGAMKTGTLMSAELNRSSERLLRPEANWTSRPVAVLRCGRRPTAEQCGFNRSYSFFTTLCPERWHIRKMDFYRRHARNRGPLTCGAETPFRLARSSQQRRSRAPWPV